MNHGFFVIVTNELAVAFSAVDGVEDADVDVDVELEVEDWEFDV